MAVKNSPDLSLGMKNVRKKFTKALNLDSKSKHDTSSGGGASPKRKKSSNSGQEVMLNSFEDIQQLDLSVHYLGYAEMISPGLSDLCVKVNSIYRNAKPYLKNLDKAHLKISKSGIVLRQENDNECLYNCRRVLYCGVDKQHQRVFSFNYQHGSRAENIHLHVLVCKNKEEARLTAKYLGQLFKRISKDEHEKERQGKKLHSEGISKSITKSSQNNISLPIYSNLDYPSKLSRSTSNTNSTQDNTCGSGTCGSGEWVPDDRVMSQLSVA